MLSHQNKPYVLQYGGQDRVGLVTKYFDTESEARLAFEAIIQQNTNFYRFEECDLSKASDRVLRHVCLYYKRVKRPFQISLRKNCLREN